MLSHALTDMDQELSALIDDAVRANMTQDEIKRLLGIDRRKTRREKVIFWIITICAALALVFAVMLGNCEIGGGFLRDLQDEFCLIDHTLSSLEVSRPIANCSMCQGLTSVPSVANISQQDFRTYHAYTGVPLVVTKATRKWTAFKVFDFKFLKRLYNMSQNDVSGEVNEGCQFFPYRTNFKSLKEVFEMSDRRAALREDQWYVGWSNCNPKVMNVIRKHYRRPQFIPDDSESSILDWIFVGGYGKGAQMHIDYVGRPSWQVQISGRKTWTLVPPPECENTCQSLSVTINKGDIFTIDTNQWFHSTYIHPGEMSITIGSEYD